MTKSISLLLAAGLLGASVGAFAQNDDKPMVETDTSMSMKMKTMDTNGDGMISREEFMKYHEDMYGAMPANADGMVDMKPMIKRQNRMMMGGKPMSIDMARMGANTNGMVTRAQYMKYHDDMYNGMQMNSQSMVDMKTMMMMK
ncbi:MAG: hypothetical protein H7293_22505 [Candidatus Saccharibacteria bacterium]|nr:hypothetical protein [Rhodoferax sp.]